MKISRFFGANSRDVMRQVRQVLGADALIVSNRSVEGGVEILATVDGDFDDAAPNDAGTEHAAAPVEVAARSHSPAPMQAPTPTAARNYSSYSSYNTLITPPVTPSPGQGYAAPRSIAAYQSAHAASALPELDVESIVEPVIETASATPSSNVAPVPSVAPLAPALIAPAVQDAEKVAPQKALGTPTPTPMPALAPSASHAPPPAASSLAPDTAAGLQEAISALRGAMETRMDGLLWGGRPGAARDPAVAGLFRTLLDAGFSTKLVRALVERLPKGLSTEAAVSWARNELVTHLPVLSSEDKFLAGGVYALVGPTGIGKTTTLAKLAARCVAREGREQVAMLTTDNFRIGALEQLQIYGRLMGVPAHSVRDAGELRRVLAELGHRKIILIDTTGISQRDRNVAEQAAMLCNAGKPVRRLLVLNAASQGDTLDEVAHAYRNGVGEDVAGCIITKLDEATRLGAALDTAIRHRLPIHYVSTGQKVPEDLELGRADVMIDRAFTMLDHARALYTPSEADLATLSAAPTTTSGSSERDGADPVRRRQLLASAILRPQGGAAALVAAQTLDDALNWLDADVACSQARDSWRDYVASNASTPLAAFAQAPLDRVRQSFSTACDRYVLSMHGKTALKGAGTPGGTLMSTLVMTDRGVVLAAPAHQLALAHGTLSTFAPDTSEPPHAGQALLARVSWMTQALSQVPQVHVLDSGTAALWPSLTEQGALWLARNPGGMRVVQDECPTTLNAVSKSLGYLPVGQPGDMPGLHSESAAGTQPLALWASGTQIHLLVRGAAGTALRLVCARLVNPATGAVVSHYFGLTNLSATQADAASVARWLVLQDQARAGFKDMGHAWGALPAADGQHALARQALMAGQLAAASWQLAHAPEGAVMQGPLAGVMGPQRKLSARLYPVALLKLFAMLEMAA